MGRSDLERYTQAKDYIKDNISAELAADIDLKVVDKKAAGKEISLAGFGYDKIGTKGQHMAIRAWNLCQIVYFRPPHAPFEYATKEIVKETAKDCKTKTEAEIQEEIKLYLKKEHLHLADLADAAETVCKVEGNVDPRTRSRSDTNVSANPVCYHGVVAWLFHAGMISKRWFAKEGNSLTGFTANQNLGDGVIVDERDWDKIPKGCIWNIHRAGDKTTCHWGVSLGNNKAIACNNTDESPNKKLAYDPGLARTGDTKYGKFTFTDICEVLNANAKYGATPTKTTGNIVVRKIDPLKEPKLY